MDLQGRKRILSYFVLFAIMMSLLAPGFFSFADVAESSANTVSGSAVHVPTSMPKATATPKPTDNWKIKVKILKSPGRVC